MRDQNPSRCFFHSSKAAATRCAGCGKPLCAPCAQSGLTNQHFCRPCCVQHGIRQRPSAGVITVAVINMIIGLTAAALVLMVFDMCSRTLDLLRLSSGPADFAAYYACAMVVLASAVALLMGLSGIAMVLLKRIGWWCAMIYAVGAVVFVPLSILIQVLWLTPGRIGAEQSSMAVTILSYAAAPIYPVILIIFLTRRMVKVQFAPLRVTNGEPPVI